MNDIMEMVPQASISITDFIKRRDEFLAYVKNCMIEGVDYGRIEGVDKPSLYKPGAEKMCTLYGFTSRMTLIEKVETWDQEKPFFKYDYKAQIIWPRKMGDGTIREEVMSECEGTCNSFESKYGYRWLPYEQLSENQKKKADSGDLKMDGRDMDKPLFVLERENPELHKKIVTENIEKPGTWKTSERDSKKIDPKTKKPYKVLWVTIPAVKQYQVVNDRVFDQVNTLMKMSQKRAFVGATLIATGGSEVFTQDVEDIDGFKTVEILKPEDEAGKDAKNVTPKPAPKAPTVETPVQDDYVFDMAKVKLEMDKAKTIDELNTFIKQVPDKCRPGEVMEYYASRVKDIKEKVKQ